MQDSLLAGAVQDSAPVTAVTFSATGTGLIVANASNHIGVYNVEPLSATDWMKSNGSKLPARLLDMPGSIASISAHPQVRQCTLLHQQQCPQKHETLTAQVFCQCPHSHHTAGSRQSSIGPSTVTLTSVSNHSSHKDSCQSLCMPSVGVLVTKPPV